MATKTTDLKGQGADSPRLYNVTTRKAEALPEDQLEAAIANGTHAYRKGTMVPVVDPDGNPVTVAADDLKEALSRQYKIELPTQIAIRKYVEQNKGTAGAARVASRAFLDGLSFGVTGAVERGVLDPLDVAKNNALAEEYKALDVASSLAGGVASLGVGGPLLGAATKLGSKASTAALGATAKAAAKGAGARLSAAATEGIAKTVARKSIEMGVEGAVLSAPQALTEAVLGSPKQAGETLLIGLGVGGALGVPTGISSNVFGRVVSRRAKIAAQREEMVAAKEAAEARAAADVGGEAAKIRQVEQVEPLFDVGEATEGIRKAVSDPKLRNEAAVRAFAEEGVFSRPYMTTELKSVKSRAVELGMQTSGPGQIMAQELKQASDDIQDVAARAVGKLTPDEVLNADSRAVVGERVRQRVINEIEARYAVSKAGYKQLEEKLESAALAPDQVRAAKLALKRETKDVVNVVKQNSFFGDATQSANQRKALQFADSIAKAKSVPDLNSRITLINGEIDKAYRNADTNLVAWLEPIRERAKAAREAVLDAAGLAGERAELDRGYAAFKSFLKQLAIETRSGKGARTSQLLETFRNTSAENMARKLFDPNNVKAMEFVKANLPEAFKELADLKRREIAASVIDPKSRRYRIYGLLANVQKLPKEARNAIFTPNQQRTIENLRQMYNAFPQLDNPGSAAAHARLRFTSDPIAYLTQNVSDQAVLMALRNEEAHAAFTIADDAMRKISAKLDEIPDILDRMAKPAADGRGAVDRGVKPEQPTSLSSKGLAVVLSLLGDDDPPPKNVEEAYERMRSRVLEPQVEPKKSEKKRGMVVQTLQEGGLPTAATAYQDAALRSTQYLAEKLPKPFVPDSLVTRRKFRPSDAEMTKFMRRVEAAFRPLNVLNDLRDGTLTREQVETLDAIYPEYMRTIRGRVIETLADKERTFPYSSRLKLSLLLGMDLDPSLSPDSIRAMQAAFAEQAQQGQGAAPQGQPPSPNFRPQAAKDMEVSKRSASEADRVNYRMS